MQKLVVSLMVFIEDGWYGSRIRYYYAGENGEGFKNKTEARKASSLLKKYVKQRIKHKSNRSISGGIEIGDINSEVEMPTYRYCGAGPSWACNNYEVPFSDINVKK